MVARPPPRSRVCADGRALSRLVGSCSGQATSRTVNADRDRGGIRASHGRHQPPGGRRRRGHLPPRRARLLDLRALESGETPAGSPGSTGTSGIPGTSGLIPGAGDPITTSAPLRPVVSASGALPFTGAASDLLALAAGGLLAAGVLVVRATRLATAATKGGDDR